MKKEYSRYGLVLIVIISAFTLLVSCGSGGGGADEEAVTEEGGEAEEEISAAAVLVTASPSSINPSETSDITTSVYDASGNPVSGVQVIFTLSDPTLGYINPSQVSTSSNGEATSVFTARDHPGTAEVTATAGSVDSSPREIVILDQTAPDTINLNVNPDSILVQGTATVTAEVLDAQGDPVPNGTTVMFEVENLLYGGISETSVTNNGVATATFTAANEPGTATINVSSGSATTSIDIEILQAPAAAIEFLSAEPQCIAIKETGGTETSVIKFVVYDSNGNPLSDVSVSFTMVGPNGGEYIDPTDDGTPDQIDVSSDEEGIAQVILHSGYVAGPVSISATIDVSGTPMTAQSSVVSIGGGVPSARRFSVASTLLNLPGLEYNNRTADITAYLADRFGNYNVLIGTTVSFATEVGLAIDTSQVTLAEDGLATVTVRTQWPVDPDVSGPEDVLPESWETQLQTYLQNDYGYSTTAHPRDGLCAVLVYVKGEEHFDDANANGIYDQDETFDDTYDDPFIDYNDDGLYDGPASDDPEEIYVDSGSDGEWDGNNGIWDNGKYIFANFPILITGSPMILFNPVTFAVPDGGSQAISVIVCDRNLNQLPSGSKVTIFADVGKLVGQLSREYADSNAVGPTSDGHRALIEYQFHICDDSPGTDPPAPEAGCITVSVDWEGLKTEYSIYGTVD